MTLQLGCDCICVIALTKEQGRSLDSQHLCMAEVWFVHSNMHADIKRTSLQETYHACNLKLSAVKSRRNMAMNSRCVAYHADGLELGVVSGAVLLGVVAENSGTVEGAVILREVQPALEAVRALSSDTQPNDVR